MAGECSAWGVWWDALSAPLQDGKIVKLPTGAAADCAFGWLKTHGRPAFNWIKDQVESLIDATLWLLQLPHPLVVAALFVALTWLIQRRWQPCVLVGLGFLYIINQGYWEETTETLTLVLYSCVICMGIGVPVGIAAAHRPRLYAWLRPVLDLMQTLPTPVYLIPFVILFRLGMVPGLMATIIFVVPAAIRLTQLGIVSTPRALIEASTAFGATKRQTLWKVELPWAFPQIMAGLNQTIMLSLSMVVIAAWVGADGLGVPVVRALNTVNAALGFEAGSVIVVLAIMLDRMLRVER